MNNRALKLCAAGVMAAVFSTSVALAQAQASQDDLSVAGLLKFENARVQAEAHYDAAALDRDLSDELVLGHGGGDVINKQEYLQGIKSATTHFVTGIDLSHQSGVIYGNIGVTNGIMANHLMNNMNHVSRYLGVYKYYNSRWYLIRWQTTDISRPKH